MTPAIELLSLTSRDALFRIAQDMLDEQHPGLVSTWYVPSKPSSITRTRTQVVFSLDRAITPVDNWDALSEFVLEYDRLAIDQIVRLGEVVKGFLPTDTTSIAESALRAYRISMDKDDFTDQVITNAGTVTLSASEDSYRWIGTSDVDYQILTIPITDLIYNKDVVTNFGPHYSSANIRGDIIRHLNANNQFRVPRELNQGDVRFGTPLTEENVGLAVNTKIMVFSVGNDFTGSSYIRYKRREYQQSWVKPITVEYDGEESVVALLPSINRTLGCTIVESDIDNLTVEVKPLPGRTVPILVNFKPTSLGFVGYLKLNLFGKLPEV